MGFGLGNWWSGNETEAKRLFDVLANFDPKVVNITELKKLPLLFTPLQLRRIQGAMDKWHK